MRTKKNSTPRTKKDKSKAPPLRRLATADLRRLPKPRAGYEQYVEPLLQLLAEYGDELGPCSVDPAAVRASLAKLQQLAPRRAEAAENLALFDNTMTAESSSIWTQLLVIYKHAELAGETSLDVRARIQAFEQFMAVGPRKKAPIATPTP